MTPQKRVKITTEVPVDNIENGNSVVATNLIQTLSWKGRKVKFITEAKPGLMDEVLLRIIPLIGADKIIEKLIEI
jgi:mRNA interferase MazF